MTDQLATDEATVQALCAIEEGLTDWESRFVEEIASQVIDQRRPLTERQRAKAEQILEERGIGA